MTRPPAARLVPDCQDLARHGAGVDLASEYRDDEIRALGEVPARYADPDPTPTPGRDLEHRDIDGRECAARLGRLEQRVDIASAADSRSGQPDHGVCRELGLKRAQPQSDEGSAVVAREVDDGDQ